MAALSVISIKDAIERIVSEPGSVTEFVNRGAYFLVNCMRNCIKIRKIEVKRSGSYDMSGAININRCSARDIYVRVIKVTP